MHEWMVDNGFTPHIVVDAARDGVRVPPGHVQDGKIVLNVSPSATRALSLGNDVVTFEARFNGVAQQLAVPVAAVLGIYARETGQGMLFSDEDATPPATPAPDGSGPQPPAPGGGDKPRPKLKVIK
jgi:stringent starvation protein B